MTLNERIDALEGRLQTADATLRLMRNAPMARYTTLHLGGPASLLACPDKPEQVQLLLKEAHALDVPVIIIGNGSNLLVKDGGIRGLVIRLCRDMQHIEVQGNAIRAEAGAMMSTLSMAAAEANPNANFVIEHTTGLCSFYAEAGGLMIGFEGGYNTNKNNNEY